MSKDTQQPTQPEPLLTEESTVVQRDLFIAAPLVRTRTLTDQSSIGACALPYQQELELRGKSSYTVTCFLSDLKMLSAFVGRETPVGRITKEQLTDWLMKLKFGVPGHTPAPKTMARRVTVLKNFFSPPTREAGRRADPPRRLYLQR